MKIEATCKRCRKYFTLEYEPNEFLSEAFVRNSAVCASCQDRHATKLPDRQFIQKPEARLPYKEG